MSIDVSCCQSPHTRQGGVWAYVSPSLLNCWLTCGLKFKLTYIDGLRTPATPSLFVGKMTHAGLERLYRHRHLGIALSTDDLAEWLMESWDQSANQEGAVFPSAAEEQVAQRQTIDLLRAYASQMPPDEPRPLAVEIAAQEPLVDPFSGEDLVIPLLGIMDLVLYDPAGPRIVDFKTSARSTEPLPIVHEVQLSCYAWLFRQVRGCKEGGLQIRSLIKTKTPKVEYHDYPSRGENHIRRLFTVIRAYLDGLDSGRFVYRPGFGCGMCDFQATHCARWCG